MESREYLINTGIETSTLPDPGTPTDPYDLIYLSYLEANYSKGVRVTNSIGSPYSAVAGTSIAHGLQDDEDLCVMFLQGNGAGTTDMSANPQIAVPTKIGQRLILVFTSDANRVKLEDGTGLNMKNGDRLSLNHTVLEFLAVSLTAWTEISWNGVGDV